MAEYIDRKKIPWPKVDSPKGKYWDRLVCESIIESMEPADVIERGKINKAIEEMTNLEKSCTNMITDEKTLVNECYEQYAELINECINILKRNIEG